ncbi:cystathionine gamma-synthase [Nitrosococcus oceani ATCC 19707]|uniref:Cystathionine gamma-synthase n=2 Tax=Nitrosococcus oceani TaxID=1229 RepID=Q3JCU1_NITOC|nr:PLP-dependent aspartate aminotransferase family protein [Nitrosococcus oceani]ABA57355.1 cystathionine gamma-synthase [Nitrosococcus oceani ATCC 19707]EDZ67105.1 Cys/Met metabolism PLP-dependent enzyme superfamily [Nitrosococcus oceani AFC27]KFI20332.1 methionine gamma-lyase [Nitrosococcus oceani C-27]GEM20231.1 methionine gamma-lyase [Nitrosococcus oceani]
MKKEQEQGFTTQVIHGHNEKLDPVHGSTTPPLYLNTAFLFENADQGARRFAREEEGYVYARMGNPSVEMLEKRLALLENGEAAAAFASGMGAISSLLLHLAQPGDHIISVREIYGGTYAFFEGQLKRMGCSITYFNPAAPDLEAELDAQYTSHSRVLYLETPSNPSLALVDLEACSRWAHKRGLVTVVDNTFCTPYLQRPLNFGIDWSVHSTTKYLNGHGDCVGGVVIGTEPAIQALRQEVQWHFGNVLSPFNAWLTLRGLQTLSLRMARHSETALTVARFLEEHPKVQRVHYPGLPSHPQHELAQKQMAGFSGMISFSLASREAGPRLLNNLQLCLLAVSLGHVATLIEHPASMSHAAYSEEECRAAGLDTALVRLSVGLEEATDLIADLEQGLEKV